MTGPSTSGVQTPACLIAAALASQPAARTSTVPAGNPMRGSAARVEFLLVTQRMLYTMRIIESALCTFTLLAPLQFAEAGKAIRLALSNHVHKVSLQG